MNVLDFMRHMNLSPGEFQRRQNAFVDDLARIQWEMDLRKPTHVERWPQVNGEVRAFYVDRALNIARKMGWIS